MEDSRRPDQKLFVRAFAVSGRFLKGGVLIVGSLDDKITWNGAPILEGESSSFYQAEGDVFVKATRGEHSRHVEDPTKEGHGVNIELPFGVVLVLNRLPGHVNVAITMPRQEGGQDGLCGNFNGISSDDSLEFTTRRLSADVPPEESLFQHLD
jgi:hypothetical protein